MGEETVAIEYEELIDFKVESQTPRLLGFSDSKRLSLNCRLVIFLSEGTNLRQHVQFIVINTD